MLNGGCEWGARGPDCLENVLNEELHSGPEGPTAMAMCAMRIWNGSGDCNVAALKAKQSPRAHSGGTGPNVLIAGVLG